jgi:cytochrome b involved in lipid metabolism
MKRLLILAAALMLAGCAAPAVEQATEPTPSNTQTETVVEESQTETESTEPTTEPATEPEEVTETQAAASSPSPSTSPSPSATATGTTAAPKPSPSATATATATATPKPSPTQESAPKETSGATYTMAEVSRNNTASKCWVVVDGSVYDLTQWITKHPGGASAITSLCGKDATASFDGQHGGQARPSSTLNSYFIGQLVG